MARTQMDQLLQVFLLFCEKKKLIMLMAFSIFETKCKSHSGIALFSDKNEEIG